MVAAVVLIRAERDHIKRAAQEVAGIEGVRRALCDWLDWMGLVDAGPQARLDRMIGYYQPYATSHERLDEDPASGPHHRRP